MTKLFLIAASTLLSVATTPVVAREARTAGTDAAATTEAPAAPRRAETRYCIIDTPTGSHIQRKTCRTRDDWMKDGFDPLAKN